MYVGPRVGLPAPAWSILGVRGLVHVHITPLDYTCGHVHMYMYMSHRWSLEKICAEGKTTVPSQRAEREMVEVHM